MANLEGDRMRIDADRDTSTAGPVSDHSLAKTDPHGGNGCYRVIHLNCTILLSYYSENKYIY